MMIFPTKKDGKGRWRQYIIRAAGHTWPFWMSQIQTWKTEKHWFIDFVEHLGTRSCSMSVMKLKTWAVRKHLTDHHHLIQQLHYSSQVKLSGTEEPINLASYEMKPYCIRDSSTPKEEVCSINHLVGHITLMVSPVAWIRQGMRLCDVWKQK